jgi:hypothetical protein
VVAEIDGQRVPQALAGVVAKVAYAERSPGQPSKVGGAARPDEEVGASIVA